MTLFARFLRAASYVVTGAVVVCGALAARADIPVVDAFEKAPSVQAPPAAEVRVQALAWLAETTADDAARSQAEGLWAALPQEPAAAEVLDALTGTFALGDPRAAELVKLCAAPRGEPRLPDLAWLADEQLAPLVRHNLRLVYGRWLAREELFDEAAVELSALEPALVVDPAALLFFQGVVHHRLLNKEPGLKALKALRDDVAGVPHRYLALAGLMLVDLANLEDDSLDHISRRMGDIERRLDLGHAGPRVQGVEDGVIASLDKLIEKMEEEEKKKSGGGAGQGTIRSSKPAQDSTPMTGRGPGDTDRRDVGSSSGWGDLPPKERQEALQQIGKDFPAHYREIIEQYFRSLASEDEAGESEE